MTDFIAKNWSNLLLALVGLSAYVVYRSQRRDALRTAATLVLGRINLIEKRVSALKDDHQLGNTSVYHSKPIIQENMWEQYKHLLVKRMSSCEYEIVQQFFDNAEQIERARTDIIHMLMTTWQDKSAVEQKVIGSMVAQGEEDLSKKVQSFTKQFESIDVAFTPSLSIQVLTKNLGNAKALSGTTAFQKLQKLSFSK